MDTVCSERLAGGWAAVFGDLALGAGAEAACSVGLDARLACGASRLDAAICGAPAGRGDLALAVDTGLALRAIAVDFALAFKAASSVVGVANARAFVDAVGADPALASGPDLATAIARLGASRSSTVGIALARRCAARSFRSIGVGAFGVGRASRQSATIDRERVDHATAILAVLALGAVTRAFALDLRGAFVALPIGAIAHLTCGASIGLVATIDRDRLGLALAAVAGLAGVAITSGFAGLLLLAKIVAAFSVLAALARWAVGVFATVHKLACSCTLAVGAGDPCDAIARCVASRTFIATGFLSAACGLASLSRRAADALATIRWIACRCTETIDASETLLAIT